MTPTRENSSFESWVSVADGHLYRIVFYKYPTRKGWGYMVNHYRNGYPIPRDMLPPQIVRWAKHHLYQLNKSNVSDIIDKEQ